MSMFRAVVRPLAPQMRKPCVPFFPLSRYFSTCLEEADYKLHPQLLAKAQSLRTARDKLSKSLTDDGYDPAKALEQARLDGLASNLARYEQFVPTLDDLHKLSVSEDPEAIELRVDVLEEMEDIKQQLHDLTNRIKKALVSTHPFASYPCILEFRPGVGGAEAAIFAKDLMNMYVSYCTLKKWRYSILNANEISGADGITEGMLLIEESSAYERFRFEGGVHRVQRIPATESKGRVHTSAAAVIVLPQLDSGGEDSNEAERSFAPGEVRIDIMRARGAGGQHVNTTESAVRLTHIPTGITVSMQDSRSQHKNKAKAFMILRARLAEKEHAEKVAHERQSRSSQVASTDRSDKVRTYNYPQNRVTDHRCGFTMYDLDGCMDGTSLQALLDRVEEWAQEEEMKNLEITEKHL
ncbi:hypothetical protein V1508DRAFT_413903 [Lipomyces doorenjongii]|uniref:uncharacterized protein n=1 Tax=Lipomyces doorenjongii TaxID=383834 RepID=UPI0034CF7E82